MEVKKYPEADLSLRVGMFLSLGLVIALGVVIGAMEYRDYGDGKLKDLGNLSEEFDEVLEVPPTEQPPPPPPKIQLPQIIEVPDEEEIEEEIEVELDIEITEETVIEEVEIVEEAEEEEVDEIFTIVEDGAEFPGRYSGAFYKFVQKNLKYPSQARRLGVEGRVFLQFVVDKDGSITNVRAVRGIGAGCDEEAVRVLQKSPKWKPGKQRGRPVKQQMVLPITFKLG